VGVSAIRGDIDCDADVDLDDYAVFKPCLGRPGGAVGLGCEAYKLDLDNDIDLGDVARFMVAFTGSQ